MRLEAIHCSSLRMLCNPTGRSFFLGGGVELPDELLQFGGSAHRSRSTDMADSARRDSDSSTSSSGSSAAAADGKQATVCLKCHSAPIEFRCTPCGHHTCCKRCAMKLATAGHCLVCGEMFQQMRKIA
eukprot:m.17467 g.17467  ORF g.17467 m.17467 type:complete len:128 (-) comp3590_c0_seq2:58-441(-)